MPTNTKSLPFLIFFHSLSLQAQYKKQEILLHLPPPFSPFFIEISKPSYFRQAMMHGYFKMGNVSCRIVFDTSLYMCKIRVLVVSIACPYRIRAVFGHHSGQVFIFLFFSEFLSQNGLEMMGTCWIKSFGANLQSFSTVFSKFFPE